MYATTIPAPFPVHPGSYRIGDTPAQLHIQVTAGPLCKIADAEKGCGHSSCIGIGIEREHGPFSGEYAVFAELREDELFAMMPWWPAQDVFFCHIHWVFATTISEHAGEGFAGGRIYDAEYSCGCSFHDESDDVRAAM